MSLSLHKSQGKDKNLAWVVINSKVWAKALGCDASIIRRDRKFLINNGLIITDGKFNKGVKSLWYRPSMLAIGSLVCADSELYESIRNMNTAVEKRIIESVKKINLDTAKVLGKLRRDFLSVRLKNNGNKGKYCNQVSTQGTLQTQLQNPTRENVKCREITALAVATTQIVKLVAHNKPLCVQLAPFAWCVPTSVPLDTCGDLDGAVVEFTLAARGWLEAFVYGLQSELGFGIRKKSGFVSLKNEHLKKRLHEAASLLYAINATYDLHFKYYSISRSDTNLRIRHNVVEYPRGLRHGLSYNDLDVFNVDLTNSQPAIIVGVMLKQGVKVEQSLIDAVQDGTYYKTLEKRVGLKLPYDELKAECLSFLYSQAKHNVTESKRGGVAKAFKTMWPIAFDWVVGRKKLLNTSQEKGSRLFAIEMQRAEANWMIGKVLRRIFSFNKTIWAVPMHDGCLVSQKDAAWLKQVMEEEFSKIYGFTPTVSDNVVV